MSIFSRTPRTKVYENTFDLSHERKFSMKFGQLTPMLVQECVPGDKWTISTSQLVRFAPLVAPVMHQVSVYCHFFFVPNRILWSNFEDFITGGEDGTESPAFPFITLVNAIPGSLADYMGIPQLINNSAVNALPFAAYNKIYNDYYRDQNLIDALEYKLNDGSNTAFAPTLQNRAWQHDYFTSALPWTQRGPEATLPLGDNAPVIINTDNAGVTTAYKDSSLTNVAADGALDVNLGFVVDSDADPVFLNNEYLYEADLSGATAASINDLRQAFRLQEWLEKNARGGSRYTEVILSHFGVTSSDARLQRPEYIGGSSTPVSISEVLQTQSSDTVTPQGNMAGHGVSAGGSQPYSYFCEEHGFIMGLMSVMPKSSYQQGLPKVWTKFDKFDYFYPSFAHLGEQPVLNKELYFNTTDGENDDVFGYTPRYAEYKYIPSSVHGEFKTTLNFWHMGRAFQARPYLNKQFIEMQDNEISRVFAVTDSEKLYVHTYHRIKAKRKMPIYGIPKGI